MAVAGDRVRIRRTEDGSGTIEEIVPRASVLARSRVDKPVQIIAANVDQALLVFSAAHPEPDPYLLYQLDKLLVQAQAGKLIPHVVCNKIELKIESRSIFDLYASLGFDVVYTSVVTGEGLDILKERLSGRLSVLCGPSGVGKSSLLNAIHPDLKLRIGDVSDWTGKGRHTTTLAEMYPLGGDSWIVDTPGIRRLSLWEVPEEDVESYFPEMSGMWEQCTTPDCMHRDEPGCSVNAAVEEGRIDRRRYESYRSMIDGR